jgi:hypothetical protein
MWNRRGIYRKRSSVFREKRFTVYFFFPHLGSVETILTLHTPHAYPVISFHRSVWQLYENVNAYWRNLINYESPNGSKYPTRKETVLVFDLLLTFLRVALANVFVASLAGGYRDWLVDSDSADLSTVIPSPEHYLFTHTLAVPEVWMEQDHLVSKREVPEMVY